MLICLFPCLVGHADTSLCRNVARAHRPRHSCPLLPTQGKGKACISMCTTVYTLSTPFFDPMLAYVKSMGASHNHVLYVPRGKFTIKGHELGRRCSKVCDASHFVFFVAMATCLACLPPSCADGEGPAGDVGRERHCHNMEHGDTCGIGIPHSPYGMQTVNSLLRTHFVLHGADRMSS